MKYDGEYLRSFVCYNYICDLCPLTDSEDCYYRCLKNTPVTGELLKAVRTYMNTKSPAQRKQCSRVNAIMAKYVKAVVL